MRSSLVGLLAVLSLSCTRPATQVYVVVYAPEGTFDAVVIEARDAADVSPCLSRDAAASSAVSLLGPLRGGPGRVSSLAIAPYDQRPLRITVWGKRGGVDAARRSFIVVPRLHESRSLCVPLRADDRDCGCTDLSQADSVAPDTRLTIEAACAGFGVSGDAPAGWGPRSTCVGFSAAACAVEGATEMSCARDAGVDVPFDARGDVR